MNQKKHRYFIVIIWGTCMYALQDFINNPNIRIQILMMIGIAFLIDTANQIFMKDKFYTNKYLRHTIQIFIMNCVLIPINVVIARLNEYKIVTADIVCYFLFNVVVLFIYILQHVYYKNQINKQLKTKISTLE